MGQPAQTAGQQQPEPRGRAGGAVIAEEQADRGQQRQAGQEDVLVAGLQRQPAGITPQGQQRRRGGPEGGRATEPGSAGRQDEQQGQGQADQGQAHFVSGRPIAASGRGQK